MANKDTAKTWFKRGLKPLESQFAQVFEWLRWKDEAIAVADVQNLTTILTGKASAADVSALMAIVFPDYQVHTADFTYAMVAGRELEYIRLKAAVNQTIKIGTSLGGNQIMEELECVGGVWNKLVLDDNFDSVNRTYYISGITVSTEFYFYKR